MKTIQLKEKIKILLSLLSDEQKTRDIVEIENNDNNREIIEHLESIGIQDVVYKVLQPKKTAIQESGGRINLLDCDLSGNWSINIYNINSFLEMKES